MKLINEEHPLRRGEVVINGHSLYDDRILLAERPTIESPEPQLDLYTANGINGYFSVFHDAFNQRQATFNFSVFAKDSGEREIKKNLFYSLIGQELAIHTFNDPYGVYIGFLITVEFKESHVLNYNFTAECKFELQPFRKLFAKSVENNETNTYQFDKGLLLPIITFSGVSDTLELKVNDDVLKIKGIPHQDNLIIDFEHKQISDGRNGLSQYKITKGYPQWKPKKGKVTFDYSGGSIKSFNENWQAI